MTNHPGYIIVRLLLGPYLVNKVLQGRLGRVNRQLELCSAADDAAGAGLCKLHGSDKSLA